MNIHEYQGKAILSQFGVAVPAGIVVDNAADAAGAALTLQEKTGTSTWVVKAQIHAGGRGKGGGVKLARSVMKLQSVQPISWVCNWLPRRQERKEKRYGKCLFNRIFTIPASQPFGNFI